MANNSPTLVIASLSDDQLKKSIDSLVTHVDEAMKKMVQSTNNAVGEMEAKLKSLGNLKIDSGGSADGGASKRTKAQNTETDAVEKNVAARDKQIKKNQEAATSFDNFAKAQQVAIRSASPSGIRNADTLQTMNIQLDLLRERLREARQQYSSFVALAAHATTTGDKGLFQYATDGVHRYEQEVRNLIPQIRTLQSGIQQMGDVIAPQGHTIQNYVNSLQKANPELAALNAQYKSGTSLLQDQSTSYASATQSAQRYTEEIRKQAQAIRESKQWKETGTYSYQIGDATYYVSKKQGEIEAQLVRHKEQQVNYEKEYLTAGMAVESKTQQQLSTEERLNQVEQQRLATEREIAKARREYISPTTTTYTAPTTDMLRKFIASKAGVEVKDVKIFDETAASASKLQGALKQVQKAYSNMSAEERNSPFGQALIRRFQELQRESQKTQQQLSRPTSLKSVMGLDEKTLDDIAYKMQRLRAYKQGIDLTKPNAANEIKQVDEALVKLQKDADKWMSKSNEMIKSNTALGRSWNYMKNRLAFYFTVGASTQFVKNLIEVRSQYEMNERALGILIDSAERGTRIFNELSQMALVSPYTLIELSSAAKQLTAYDVAAKDVVDTTRRLADMAAAVGIPIERLTYALGQIKAYGYLNARDARMFSNAGIPLVKQLAEHYTELEGKMVSTADVYDRIKKKAIDMTDVMQVINKMTDEGGKFFDFQAKMAGTLKVQLANLTLAWNNMLNDIGASEQGTISTGIGLLKELFLQWKNISKMVTNLAIGFGVVKAAQLAYYGVVMGTNKAIALETVLGNRLSNSLRSLASSTNAARMSSTVLWVGIATFAAAAVVDILRGNEAMKEFNKTLRENAENTYNDLKKFSENYSGLRESLYKTENGKQTPVDINSEEAKKAWEVLREQIELSSHASDEYISKLLSIENVSERLRQGFAVIDSIQAVSAAIKEIGDSAIKLERDWSAWWNLGLLPDGTIGNLQDAYMWLSKIEEKYGSVVNARKVASTSRTDEGFKNVFQDEAKEFVENYETELEKFRKDLQVTKQSIIDFIELKGWSGDTSKINEVFKTFTDNLILKNQLNPQQAYTLQLEMEEARSKAAKEALLQRINDERAALKISHDDSVREALAADIERYKNWDETNGRSKVEWERFTKWLKEQHISETTAMFRNMDAEDIRSLNFQEGKHAEWVKRMVTQYAKEHKMSYDDAFGYLKSWVTSANQWSIFIPLTISTEDKKSVYDRLGEYDKAVDEADAQIERLTKRINELNAKKKKSKEETQELANAEQELADAQKAKADAEAKGGHGKKEKKDKKAANKAAKQAESELAKALKEELSTIEKVRSIYKDLTKEGMSHADAVERATRGWGETVNAINKVLRKNGLQKLDLSKFAGIENPREIVNMLQSQLNTLLKRGAKPAEIKELQTKVNTLEVDADKYDLTKITKGLNNELGKLKDEYELAVEMDANPELGGMFLDMFGIDPSKLTHSINEYMQGVQDAFDKSVLDMGYGNNIDLDVFAATEDSWRLWAMNVGLSEEQLDEFSKKFKTAQDFAKKWAEDVVKQTKSLQYSLADTNGKIAIKEKELADLRTRLNNETNEKQKELLRLQIQEQENAIAELRAGLLQEIPEYAALFNSIVERSDYMTRRLVANLKKIYDAAKARGTDAKGNYTITGADGTTTLIGKKQFEKEYEKLTREERKSQAPFKKIKEAFSKDSSTGLVDWAKGMELVGGELQKVQGIVSNFGNIAEALGADPATVETINDIATSIGGVATAAQGMAQIASGDYIGGAASMLSGIFTAVSTWYDNSDKKITAAIKDSELAVKKLENQYKKLQAAVEDAYGTMAYAAEKAAVYNKKLQLEEMRRQLRLEQSRESKNRDDDKIESLKGQIIDLEREIQKATDNWINDMLGISSVGDAAEQLVASMIDAFRQGEDYMGKFYDSFEEMIENMIMKAIASKVIGEYIETMWDNIKSRAEARSQQEAQEVERTQAEYNDIKTRYDDYVANENTLRALLGDSFYEENLRILEEQLKKAESQKNQALKNYEKAITPTASDVADMRADAEGMSGVIKEWFDATMKEWGVVFGDKSGKNLSNLQQGIQGITEDTAGALEGYMNGVSQQVYAQTEYLRQIAEVMTRDDDPNDDIEITSLSQILLQLRSSYEIQTAIHDILDGWKNSSGQAVRVELIN